MASTSTAETQPPSQDAFASIITQVSPTGQPARAPPRAVRPRQGQKKPSGSNPNAAAGGIKKTAPTTASSTASASTSGTARATSSDAIGTTSASPVNPVATSSTSLSPTSKDVNNGKPLPSPTNGQLSGQTDATATQSTSKLYSDSNNNNNIQSNNTTLKPPASSSTALPSSNNKTQHQQQQSSATTVAQQQKKKKRKSWLSSIFSSCMSGANHDDDDSDATMTERKAGTANAIRPGTSGTNAAGTSTTTTNGANAGSTGLTKKDGVTVVSLGKGDDKNDSNSKLGHGTESTAGTSVTKDTPNQSAHEISSVPSGNDATTDSSRNIAGPLALGAGAGAAGVTSVIVSSADGKSEIAPEILAANQPGGTPLSRDETADVLSGAVQAPGSEGLTPKKEKRRKSSSGERNSSALLHDGDASRVSSISSEGKDDDDDEEGSSHLLPGTTAGAGQKTDPHEDVIEDSEDEEYMDEEERIIAQGGMGIPVDENGQPKPLLVELAPSHHGRKCLVLDLDETLVHSSFKLIHSPDFVVPVEIENQVHNVYVIKRPGVDAFMKRMGELYEVVVFTASLSKYADPVLDHLDIHQVVKHRLFRESCYNHRGNYVKDLSQLGRPIGETIIIDNSPASYIFHPNNAVPVSSWFNDPHDTELTDLQGFLADLAEVDDVRGVLDGGLFPIS